MSYNSNFTGAEVEAALNKAKNAGTYSKPSTGIPKTDLASAIQTSLGKADTALQSIPSEYVTAEDVGEDIDDVESLFVTKAELDAAISEAITTTLNTEV